MMNRVASISSDQETVVRSPLQDLGLGGKHVCPFCGTVAEKSDDPCPRCTMENTPLTRQATRARIGPWYVMQARNPSAPGMKLATLLSLIRKGQVTGRSIVRGPTTHQLWRFAARVKGVSREFGICYSCGLEIEKAAPVCPHCSRSQELPSHPDALLESEPHPPKSAVFVEVKPSPAEAKVSASRNAAIDQSRNAAIDQKPADSKPAPEPKAASEPKAQIAPSIEQPAVELEENVTEPSAVPSPTTTMASLAGIASPQDASSTLQSRPRHLQQERILSARELAAAFSLQYNPTADGPINLPKKSGKAGRWVAAIVLLGLAGAGAAAYFVPSLHEPTARWINQTYAKLASATSPMISSPVAPEKPRVDHADPSAGNWGMKAPVVNPVVKNPTSQPAEVAVVHQPAPQPAPKLNDPVPTPAVTPASATLAPAPAHAPVSLPPPAPGTTQDKDVLAMQLRSMGLDAEAKQDYSSAEYYYEQIEKLPKENWPGDTDLRLKAVRKMISKP